MKNVTKHTGTIRIVERDKNNGCNGNPRYIVTLDGHVCKTAIDSQLGYSITNFDGKRVTADIGTHYGTLTIDNVKEALTAYKVTKNTGESYVTSMAPGVTIEDARRYFLNNTFTEYENNEEITWYAIKVEEV